MRSLTIAILLCIGAVMSIESADALLLPCTACKAAPAPAIGAGVPALLAVGGILFGANLLRRRRQSRTIAG